MSVESLPALRDAVVASLREKIPSVSIEPHGGTFDDDEIRRFALAAPAIRVAALGFGQVKRHSNMMVKLPVHFAAAIVARDKVVESVGKTGRDVAAMLIGNAVALAVAGNRFGLEGVFQPEELQGQNLYSGKVDVTGLALWQVTWTTPVLLGESYDEALGAMTKLIVNNVVFADPEPTGADPLRDPENWEPGA